ncbi:MAG: hypothetical protein LLF28_08180 [Nitrospiraceae bacterium]|nr:hypothetical protein [Nitrospiraceae bacterium]
MKIKLRSISIKLFLWIFIVASILLISSGFVFFKEVKTIIFATVDDNLHSDIQIFTGLLNAENGKVRFDLSEVVSGDYAIPLSGHYYKILINNKLFAASPSLVEDDFNFASGTLLLNDIKKHLKTYNSFGPDEEPVRVMQQEINITGIPSTIIVARSLNESLVFLERLKLFLFAITFVSICLIATAGLLITKLALSPLRTFSAKINTITHKSLGERINPEDQNKELNDLSYSFNTMLDRLQKAFDAEQRIVSDASHELKTPVSVIKSHCDVLLQKERTVQEYTEGLHIINETTAHMSEIIKNMLSLAQLDSGLMGKDSFKIVNISEVISKAVELTKIFIEKKKIDIKITIGSEINILADKNRLIEAFINIIENAVKYNTDGGSIEISTQKDNNSINVIVKDAGPGIKASDIPYVFERFYRSDQSRGYSSGSGLGLSISKAIIESHNGGIRVESEYGKGTVIIVNLPTQRSS